MERTSIDADESTSTCCRSYGVPPRFAIKQVAQVKRHKQLAQPKAASL
ncbi:MAG: hypothetical protein KME49_23580 [Brasilonema octagenarum HA4186-MV1]|nr:MULTISPECIES: hypothetical protein [Brasilonema]MBW4628411.1 hypothetical protein [Brasilonema octagenarum HA4186-MV1]